MKTYNVVLSTFYSVAQPYGNNITPIDKTNLANVNWLVNWEGLFGQDVFLYKRCRLRYKLVSAMSASLTNTANTGFLALGGVSSNQQAGNIPGTFIGIITPYIDATAAQNRFEVSTLADMHGVEINIPTGVSELAVRFFNDDAMTYQSNVQQYVMQLQLELFNE